MKNDWLISKSRNQICCKLAVREWLSQQSVLDRVVINTHPWHLFECYERMREGVTKEKRPSERGNSWLTPVTGWMLVFLFIRAAHLISLCLLEIILWKWNGNNPNERITLRPFKCASWWADLIGFCTRMTVNFMLAYWLWLMWSGWSKMWLFLNYEMCCFLKHHYNLVISLYS